MHPPPDDDPAGQAVLKALARPIGMRQSWSLSKALVVSLLTFGVVPIFAWIRGFRSFAAAEQQQLLHLAKWLRASSSHPLAKRLEEDAEQLRPRWWIWSVAILAVMGTATILFSAVADSGARWPHYVHALVTHTYRARWFKGDRDAANVYTVWIWGLSLVYFCHWSVVQLHALDVKRFVGRFNKIAESEGIQRVMPQSLGVPLVSPLWIVAAFLMVALHAPWGLLAMVAGAAQRRYINHTGRKTRAALAHRVRALLMRRSETTGLAADVPVPVYIRQRCSQPMCRAELPPEAVYCRRCGARQRPQVDRIA